MLCFLVLTVTSNSWANINEDDEVDDSQVGNWNDEFSTELADHWVSVSDEILMDELTSSDPQRSRKCRRRCRRRCQPRFGQNERRCFERCRRRCRREDNEDLDDE